MTIELFVNGSVVPVAQLGPDFVILERAIEHPPCDAELLLRVDANEERWSVRLPDGLTSASREARILNA